MKNPEPEVTFPERNSARGRCVSCGEYWKKFERFIQVCMNGKIVRGERYCCGCEHIARINNPTPTRQQAGDQRMAELKARNVRRAAEWHKASEPERQRIYERRMLELAKHR